VSGTCIARIGEFHRARHHRELDVGLLADIRVAMKILRIALGHEQRVLDLILRIRERDLLAALRRDVHAGRDHVEAARAQARNQRAPFGQHAVHFLHAHPRKNLAGDFRRFAGHLAVRRRVRERRFVRVADTHFAGALDALQRRFSRRMLRRHAQGRRGDAEGFQQS
jgi:hypothetical protein